MTRDPLANAVAEAYWEAAADGQLVVPRCGECGETFFPPRSHCPYCLAADVDLVESTSEAAIYSYSVVRTDSHPVMGESAPYVVALVELDAGVIMMSVVRTVDVEAVSVGSEVTPAFDQLEVDSNRTYPVFDLVE